MNAQTPITNSKFNEDFINFINCLLNKIYPFLYSIFKISIKK